MNEDTDTPATRIVYIDAVGGAAGDMLLAALLDAGAPEEAVREAVEAVLPGRVSLAPVDVRRGGLRATLLRIQWANGVRRRSVRELFDAIERSDLPLGVRRRGMSALERLVSAEERVHGLSRENIDLHELSEEDTLLDVVGVVAALDAMGIERILVGPVPASTEGAVPGSHAHLPLPAPVTLELLRGFVIRHEQAAEELVTPTAAAIFAALAEPADCLPDMTVEAVGYGAGTRDPQDRANVVRVIVGLEKRSPQPVAARDLRVLEANLDDLTPELVADAAEALFAAGALDVWTGPVHMKKGRVGVILSALCGPELESALEDVFFEATSTFGVRSHAVRRVELARKVVTVAIPGGEISVKLGILGERVVSATPEHDDVATLAARLGRPVRDVYEEAAAAARQQGPGRL